MTSEPSNTPVPESYTISYARGKGSFRVYISIALCVFFAGIWFYQGSELALALAVFFAVTAYYFFPLIESEKIRLGAGEHGLFIEGFGVIPWRSVHDITLSSYFVRTLQVNELHIKLARPLPNALMADWRSLPYHRLFMKLPWSMGRDNVVRVNLEPFGNQPNEIVEALQRNWRYFGR